MREDDLTEPPPGIARSSPLRQGTGELDPGGDGLDLSDDLPQGRLVKAKQIGGLPVNYK